MFCALISRAQRWASCATKRWSSADVLLLGRRAAAQIHALGLQSFFNLVAEQDVFEFTVEQRMPGGANMPYHMSTLAWPMSATVL